VKKHKIVKDGKDDYDRKLNVLQVVTFIILIAIAVFFIMK